MPLQTPNTLATPQASFGEIVGNAQNIKALAQNALIFMQANPITTPFVFSMLDQLGNVISSLNILKATTGLDAYATAQGYVGSLVADCGTCATAAQTCITWIVTNFPSSGGFLQAEKLNADGSRTPASFTPAQTAGLQTDLQAFINTIG